MAVSQDLPAIYNFAQYKASKNSEVFDASGEPIGTLTSNENKILLSSGQISPNVKNAVVSIEDARFYEHDGVDFQGIGRALVKDILSQSAAQGASTITEQFVKDALAAQSNRTVLPEVPRGGARLPAGAPLEQGQDPHRVPQHDLLRRGRLRDRGRRADLLRRRPPGLRHRDRALRRRCSSPGRRRRWPGSSPRPRPTTRRSIPENALMRRNLVLERMYEQGYITVDPVRGRDHAGAARPGRHRAADARLRGALLHLLAAPAAGRTLRRREDLLRRAEGQDDARPAPAGRRRRSRSAPTSAACPPPPRWS